VQLSEEELAKFVMQQAILNERLSTSLETMTKDMHSLVKSVQGIEKVISKIDSLEKESNERNKRLHQRLNDLDQDLKEVQQSQNGEGCAALQKVELAITNLEDKLLDPENGIIPNIKKDVKEEKKSRLWLWRTLFTVIFTALVGLLLTMFAPD